MIKELINLKTAIHNFDNAVNNAHDKGQITDEEMKEFKRNNYQINNRVQMNIKQFENLTEVTAWKFTSL